MSASRPSTPTQGTPHVVWSDAARALGGLALAERRWYLVVRCLMMGVLVTLIAGHYLFGLTLHTTTTIIVLALIMPPTMMGVWLHITGRFTDGWLLALLLSDVAVLTIGNHWSGGVESSFGYSFLAVVLAFRDAAPNLFAGFQLSATQEIKVGEYIKLETGEEGYVTEISWNMTHVKRTQKARATGDRQL